MQHKRNRSTDAENKYVVTNEEGEGRNGRKGVGDLDVQTTMCKINKYKDILHNTVYIANNL